MFGLGIFTWIKIGAVLLAVGAFAWLVDDYGYQRHRAEVAEGQIETLAAANAGSARAIQQIQTQNRADDAATRAALDRRTADALSLAQQLASLREIPDDPSCPLPGSIRSALGLLRD